MLSGVDGSGTLTILGMSDSHFIFERDRVVCLCQSRNVREIIGAPRRSHVELPRPRAVGAAEVFWGSARSQASWTRLVGQAWLLEQVNVLLGSDYTTAISL